jgi:hypothetical protein
VSSEGTSDDDSGTLALLNFATTLDGDQASDPSANDSLDRYRRRSQTTTRSQASGNVASTRDGRHSSTQCPNDDRGTGGAVTLLRVDLTAREDVAPRRSCDEAADDALHGDGCATLCRGLTQRPTP